MFNEENLEVALCQMLENLSIEYRNMNEYHKNWLSSRRFDDFICVEELKSCLQSLNNYDEYIIDDAIKAIIDLDERDIFLANQKFHKYLKDGIRIDNYEEDKRELVKIIDYENIQNNSFYYVRQLDCQNDKSKRIPDVILYINGIPMVIFELKSIDYRKDTFIEEAFLQLGGNSYNDGYRYDIPELFFYNAFNVISDGATNLYGTISSSLEWFKEWKSVDGESGYSSNCVRKLDILIEGLIHPKRLLDVIKNNLFFQTKKKSVPKKVITQYHQYFGVLKSHESIKNSIKPIGNGKAGIVWHTQGSGKSLSMLMLSSKLINDKSLNNPTIIVLTDRNDLDEQLFNTFTSGIEYLKTTPVKVDSKASLIDELSEIKTGGVVFTTIWKFDKENIVPNLRENIIVISDEAHRSHYGIDEKIVFVNDENGNKVPISKYGMAKYIRDVLPNATFIGYTGTPVDSKDKSTTAIFGDIIDIYDMTQSVIDGATVPLYYESRLARVWLDDTKLKLLDDYYSKLKEEGVTEEILEESKRRMSKMELLLGNKERLTLLANDIIEHYNNRKNILNGKAMIVVQSRKIAFDLYNIMTSIEPSLTEILHPIVSTSNKDSEEMRSLFKTKKFRDNIDKDFKDSEGKTKIVIVVDMWLTGFDVPDLDVMYFDKKLRSHNLMQAIARVNRVSAGKESGLIVDYVGLNRLLDEAISKYTKRDIELNIKDISEQAKHILFDKIDILEEMLHGIHFIKFNSSDQLERFKLIQDGAEIVLKNEDTKKNFLKVTKDLKLAHAICSGLLDDIMKNRVLYFVSVRHFIMKLERGNSPINPQDINKVVAGILADAVKGDEVKILTKKNKKEDILELLNPEKIEKLRKSTPPNVFLEILKKLLEEAISEYKKYNLTKSQKYSERLRKLLERYHMREENFDAAITIAGLKAFVDEIYTDSLNAKELGIEGREKAFYDALRNDDLAVKLMTDETFKLIALELKKVVEEYADATDAFKRKTTIAKMRTEILKVLLKYDYPPEFRKEAIENVLETASYIFTRH